MQGLFQRGCFRKHYYKDLTADQRRHCYGSRFHHKIKRNSKTGVAKSLKTRLVVMSNQMKQGDAFVDAFAPVPRSAVGCILMSMAAACDMEMHCVDFSQAFIQADWAALPEKSPQYFIRPPSGWAEEPGVVYECLRPLYGIPSSASALHFTLDHWMKEEGFTQSSFEDSVWIRKADALLPHDVIMSAHIDDTLILCESLTTMEAFKTCMLARFDGTDEGDVTEYLGCKVVRDRAAKTLHLRQSAYIQKVLAHHGFTDANPVKTPMEPGVRLSKRYCPSVVDPAIHAEYRAIVGHISFIVQMTRPDLAFAFAELSKFMQCPGVPHLKAARRVLAYLAGTAHEGITYSHPIHDRHVNSLFGWVDSDYAADPDTRRSVTGYVISLNNGPISWKAKQQSCTTLSSAEAEFVAASLCGQEVIYLRNLLRDLGHSQGARPTTIYEDNASCIFMSENPVNVERSRHIDTRKYFLRDMVRDGILKLKKCA
eukprot:2213300-Rhodomonas_salina.1